MRKLFLIILVTIFSTAKISAQKLSSGFYRVQNYGSKNYLYVRDCTGSAKSTETQDLDAIELWAWDDNILSDPGSIMYADVKSSTAQKTTCDISSQNTSIHKMIGYDIEIWPINGNWQLYYGGSFLFDVGSDKKNPGSNYSSNPTHVLGGYWSGILDYSEWSVNPVSSSSDNYFGFTPMIIANGKYYTPFYAAFAYAPINDNVKTWYVSKIDETKGTVVLTQINGTVAASQPVIVECVGASASDNKVDLTMDSGTSATSNLLKGTYFCNEARASISHTGKDPAIVKFDASTMRVLSFDDNGNLIFTNNTDITYIPHNTSYLKVSTSCPAVLKVLKPDEPTGISNVSSALKTYSGNVYTTSGTKINNIQKDQIYVAGGKKFLNK